MTDEEQRAYETGLQQGRREAFRTVQESIRSLAQCFKAVAYIQALRDVAALVAADERRDGARAVSDLMRAEPQKAPTRQS